MILNEIALSITRRIVFLTAIGRRSLGSPWNEGFGLYNDSLWGDRRFRNSSLGCCRTTSSSVASNGGSVVTKCMGMSVVSVRGWGRGCFYYLCCLSIGHNSGFLEVRVGFAAVIFIKEGETTGAKICCLQEVIRGKASVAFQFFDH